MSMRTIFTKKRIIWTIILLIAIGGFLYNKYRPKNNAANISTAIVSQQKIEQTILSTGQVVSETNLNLSFQTGGVVQKINVVIGAKVKAGDILAILSQSNAKASFTSASGQLAQARANYKKVLAGATPEQINVSQKAVDSAQVAYNNSLSQLTAIQGSTASAISQAQITLDDLDKEKQILDDSNLKDTFGVADASSLNNFKIAYGQVQTLLNVANTSLLTAQSYKTDENIYQAVQDSLAALNQNIISLGYCYSALQNSIISSKFSQTSLDTYKSAINAALSSENSGITLIKSSRQALTDALTAATNALTNSKLSATTQINSAQNQINSAKASLQQAIANLAQQKAKAQPADIDAALAQLLSAQGTVEAAQTALDNTVLKAPSDGTITQIDTKVGQQATAMQEVFVLQNINSLHTEAYVSESNVASLKIGQPVDYTFDALGPDQHYSGQIMTINPASTVISGVVNYLVKADLPNIPEIKPGMTVNMTVLVASRDDALAVSSSAIINQNGEQFVRVIDDSKTKKYHEQKVQTGLQADGGLVEILSGLSAGQEIVIQIK